MKLNRDDLHEFQNYGVDFIINKPISALMLECGLGKTITTLTAVSDLMYDYFEVSKVLIIAPLRVGLTVWKQECDKWEQLKYLRCSIAIGSVSERHKALQADADIYIINRENVEWLVKNYPFDFDMVVVDELSSFKSHQSKRFRALRKVRPKLDRIVGLTGTPAPNGLMDLWAEINLLDMGERLGRYITRFRDEYFKPDKRNGAIVYQTRLDADSDKKLKKLKTAIKRISDKTDVKLYQNAIKCVEKNLYKSGWFQSTEEIMTALELIRCNVKVHHQVRVYDYFVDFVLPDYKVILEIDGKLFHGNDRAEKEYIRDEVIAGKFGDEWEVVHIDAENINMNITKLIPAIKAVLKERHKRKI